MSIVFKQGLRPQNRGFDEVVEMLLSVVQDRLVILLCKGCRGEHVCFDPALTIHCACGTVTRYKAYALFLMWSSIPWSMQSAVNRGNCCVDTNPFRQHSLSFATIEKTQIVKPQPPIDTRVNLWRFRRSQ